MRWMLVSLCCAVTGCGSVKDSKAVDAPPASHDDGSIDSPPGSCTVHDQPASCGATCQVCTGANDRFQPTCVSNACGQVCKPGYPLCSDNSCGKLLFDFTDGSTEGAHVVAPSGLTPVVRMHNGSNALAFDIPTSLSQIEVTFPVCLSGGINESTRTLSAEVYFEGGTVDGGQYYVQASVPAPATGQYLKTLSSQHNIVNGYSDALSVSTGSSNFDTITFRIGSFGAAFTGTIWIDNISIH